jgi:hypothetical protein
VILISFLIVTIGCTSAICQNLVSPGFINRRVLSNTDVYDVTLADTYFQFNDETVRATTAKEVLQDTTGSNANPYLLVYAKKGSQAIEVMTRERKRLLAELQTTVTAPVVEELPAA